MARIEVAIARLLHPGFGVLVVDDYARAAIHEQGLTPDAGRDLIELALRSPTLRPSLGGLLLSPAHLALLRPPVAGAPGGDAAVLGVQVDVRGQRLAVSQAIDGARDAGATFVEIRANRRPVDTPRRDTHVDAPGLAWAAAHAHGAGIVPVITVALPGLTASSAGLTRAVVVNAARAVFRELSQVPVDPHHVLVRLPLITPGPRADPAGISNADVAQHTLDALHEGVPDDVPAVWFLSAGHPMPKVCAQLREVSLLASARGDSRRFGFAIGRALIEQALDGWVTGGAPRAGQRLGAACEAARRALVPALAGHDRQPQPGAAHPSG